MVLSTKVIEGYIFSIIVPLSPSGFNITRESFAETSVNVLFQWTGPMGSGPHTVIDHYIIRITPIPLHPALEASTLPNTQTMLNATLNYNTPYTVTLVAENCAGQSEVVQFPNIIEYG